MIARFLPNKRLVLAVLIAVFLMLVGAVFVPILQSSITQIAGSSTPANSPDQPTAPDAPENPENTPKNNPTGEDPNTPTGPKLAEGESEATLTETTPQDSEVTLKILDWNKDAASPSNDETRLFAPDSPPLAFGFPNAGDALPASGTFEFWFSPHASGEAAKDAILFEVTGPQGTGFSVELLKDRSGLLIWNSNSTNAYVLAYDFSKDKAYHLAVLSAGDVTAIVVDGEFHRHNVPIGFGANPVDQIVLGGSETGTDLFYGKIARFRFWDELLSVDQLRAQSVTLTDPGIDSNLYGRLAYRIDLSLEVPELVPGDDIFSPTDVWWHHFGSDYVRVHNKTVFGSGDGTACTSSHLVQIQRAQNNTAARCGVDRILSDSSGAGETSSIYPVFSMEWVDGDPATLAPALRATRGTVVDMRLDDSVRLKHVSYDKTSHNGLSRLAGLQFVVTTPTGIIQLGSRRRAFEDGVKVGLAQKAEREGISHDNPNPVQHPFLEFDDERRITGIEYFEDSDGIIGMRLLTTLGLSLWMGGDLERYEAVFRRDFPIKTLKIPPNANFLGLRVDFDLFPHAPDNKGDWTFMSNGKLTELRGAGLFDVTIMSDPGFTYPGLILRTELGEPTRFARIAPNVYRATRATTPLSSCDGTTCAYPTLTFVNEDLFTIEGSSNDFVPAAPHEAPNEKDEFNNTFVSLSKAVNLQANYTGYNIAKMDPLHLLDTGSGKQIFQMPDGRSTNYHDFNRIFVPNGLFYVPEFSGEYESHTAEVSSIEQFKNEHSKSVGVNLSSEALPAAFNFSRTVQKGRETIQEQSNSVTIGRTRALFYSLVLDKPRMAITPEFKQRIYRMAETGNFDQFIDVFGTHYPISVMYGGLGVLQVAYSSKARQNLLSKSVDLQLEASVLLSKQSKTRAGGSFGITTENQKSYREEMGEQVESFYWVGGTHVSGGQQGWGVGTDGVVPIHVALRPIDELLVHPYFSDPEITGTLRNNLKKAIDAYLIRTAEQSRRNGDQAQTVFVKIRADRLVCLSGGDEGDDVDTTSGARPSIRFSSTQNVFDWKTDEVRANRTNVRHEVAMTSGFEYTCGTRSTDDLLAAGNTPETQRDWIVEYDLTALRSNVLTLTGNLGDVLLDGTIGVKGFDERPKNTPLGPVLCRNGPCVLKDMIGKTFNLSVNFEEYAEIGSKRNDGTQSLNHDLCMETDNNDRDDCALLRLDLSFEVLK